MDDSDASLIISKIVRLMTHYGVVMLSFSFNITFDNLIIKPISMFGQIACY